MNDQRVSEVRPWFRGDFLLLFRALYFALRVSATISGARRDVHYWRGYLIGLASVGKAVGVKPESFMAADDVAIVESVK